MVVLKEQPELSLRKASVAVAFNGGSNPKLVASEADGLRRQSSR